MKKQDKLKIKLRSNPYKGILKEIAAEQGTSQQSIWNAIHVCENPRILTILNEKLKQRKTDFLRTQKQLAEFAN